MCAIQSQGYIDDKYDTNDVADVDKRKHRYVHFI